MPAHNPAILSVPAHKPQWLEPARLSGARVMWDLEDGVPDECKDSARHNVMSLARRGDLVRVNFGERFESDVRAVDSTQATLVFPKVESPDCDYLQSFGSQSVIIESPESVQRVDEIVSALKPSSVLFGWVDLLASAGLTTECSDFLEHCRMRVVMSCRARGIPVYDGPPLGDTAAEAARARRQGFNGMGCIHPKQVSVVRDAFTYQTVDEVEFLRQIGVYGSAIPKPLQEIASRC